MLLYYINFERRRTALGRYYVICSQTDVVVSAPVLYDDDDDDDDGQQQKQYSVVSESLGVLSVEKSNACIREFCTRNLFYLQVYIYIFI